jgi:hypothetical protein
MSFREDHENRKWIKSHTASCVWREHKMKNNSVKREINV